MLRGQKYRCSLYRAWHVTPSRMIGSDFKCSIFPVFSSSKGMCQRDIRCSGASESAVFGCIQDGDRASTRSSRSGQRLVRAEGLEPPRISPQAPKTCASANSATPASVARTRIANSMPPRNVRRQGDRLGRPICLLGIQAWVFSWRREQPDNVAGRCDRESSRITQSLPGLRARFFSRRSPLQRDGLLFFRQGHLGGFGAGFWF